MIKGRGPIPILSLIISYRHTYVGHLHRFFYRSMVQMYLVQGHELRKLPLLKVMEVSRYFLHKIKGRMQHHCSLSSSD